MADLDGNDTANVVSLFDGEPQAGFLHHGHYRYYEIMIEPERTSLTFTLTRSVALRFQGLL